MGYPSRTPRLWWMSSRHNQNMSRSMNMSEARASFYRLVREAESGEEIVITHRGNPVACLSGPPTKKRVFGLDAGAFTVSDDFDDPLPDDLLDEFDGRGV
jgi:prevent-host-death family protein